jgi:NitT/TauT family transport system substrate-binding protein
MPRERLQRIMAFGIGLFWCATGAFGADKIRVGYFPNITHAQALIGLADGTFQKALGPDVTIEIKAFNAGPSAVEALFAGAIDLTYIGPGPAINGFVRSDGAVRIVSGACSGGAALIVREDVPMKTAQDLRGKRIATPQLGNTQDIAARLYLKKNGLAPVENGGDVQLLPIANPDQLTLFIQKRLDAAWAPEPWTTRLVKEGHGRVFLDERALWPKGRFATTVVLVNKTFLDEHPDLVKKWLIGHVQVTRWIQSHSAEARASTGREIQKLTAKALPEPVLAEAWRHLEFTTDPITDSLRASAQGAYELGFLRAVPQTDALVDLTLLRQVIR